MRASQTIKLDGRKVLVTGAARGLGAGFARALIEAGAQVVLSDVLNEQGEALAAELGAHAHYVPIDLLDSASIQQGVDQAAKFMGGLNCLINNAAITHSGGKNLEELTSETWDLVMDVNVRGTWLVTRAATPYLAASRSGRIVNVASDTALWGAPRLLAYVASKGALIAMTKSLARELGRDGICVNAIAPGLTVVEATQYIPQARHDLYLQGRAIQRPQLPEDVNAATLFLLAEASGFITGQLLAVNGGFIMH